ncbi:MAG TPA: hypothetical protein VMB26_12405 [Candidatus Binataceae bacterium]|nr:hypothetical protein [Candidatus Binataceae bacterium]
MRNFRFLAASIALITAAGCLQVQPQPAVPPTTMSSIGPFGSFTMTSGSNCTGYATLSGSQTSVTAACFTGSDNIVMCTNTTAANPVMCMPGDGHLTIGGTTGDVIAYARVR